MASIPGIIGGIGTGISILLGGASSNGGDAGPYRPSQWSGPALFSITIPATTSSSATVLVFDAILRGSMSQPVRPTEHPVQSGSNISDHAVVQPARVTLEIGMSDAMDEFASGMWGGASSKSVNAFQTLTSLKNAITLVTLTTSLMSFSNMLITDVQPQIDGSSLYGLRATVSFQQLFIASVTTTQTSARPETTDSITNGAQSPSGALPQSVLSNNVLAGGLPDIPGTSPLSSYPLSNGPSL